MPNIVGTLNARQLESDMTYDLLIGDKSYSSWSLRAWLLFEHFGIPVRCHTTEFYQPGFVEDLKPWFPARTVPVVRSATGALWTDSLAIVEGLAEENPDIGLWPKGTAEKSAARSMISEMHSGFMALRSECPMNLRQAWLGMPVSEAVQKDLERLSELWDYARTFAVDGPWLFGRYTAADAYFAPVAARIAGYGLPVGDFGASYVAAHLHDGAFRRWRALGEARDRTLTEYDKALPKAPWPGPAPLSAQALETGPAENQTCPYSGKPVTHFLEIAGRAFGVCNAGCRDKTVADPEAWPAFMKIYQS